MPTASGHGTGTSIELESASVPPTQRNSLSMADSASMSSAPSASATRSHSATQSSSVTACGGAAPSATQSLTDSVSPSQGKTGSSAGTSSFDCCEASERAATAAIPAHTFRAALNRRAVVTAVYLHVSYARSFARRLNFGAKIAAADNGGNRGDAPHGFKAAWRLRCVF